jgi:hypothetical protein
VSCTSKRACVALVASNSPEIARWNSRNWAREKVPKRAIYLSAVSCSSSTACVAVGDNGQTGASLVLQPQATPLVTG